MFTIPTTTSSRPIRRNHWLWALIPLDMMTVIWMHLYGNWFDQTSGLTRVVTLGGHHLLVELAAAGGLVLLVALAAGTRAFTSQTPAQGALLAVAVAVSLVALSGFVSVLALVVGIALLVGLLGRLLR